MKIYTKTGDDGTTSLIGGRRIPKYDLQIEAYGTVDELNSYVGLLRDQSVEEHTKKILIKIQDRLLTICSILASDTEKSNLKIPTLNDKDIELLEKEIDKMAENLPPLSSFVLPGGHTAVSFCHIARNVCRRAERITVQLAHKVSLYQTDLVIKYLNRLSDYLFILSRKFSSDYNAEEIIWKK